MDQSEEALTGDRAPTFSVCIPAYNSSGIIGDTLKSVLRQTFTDFEILVVDDASTDDTAAIVHQLGDSRLRFYRNERNLGLPGNFRRINQLARGEFLYLLGNDDILAPFALERTWEAFRYNPDVAVVTRPYYWFQSTDVSVAVRHISPLNSAETKVITVDAGDAEIRQVIDSVGQISGLAFRRSAMVGDFDDKVFTTHISPFLATFREHKLAFLHEYVVAIRIASSQTRYLPSIYKPSPTKTWMDVAERAFPGSRFRRQRRVVQDMMASHFTGLIQIRVFAPYGRFVLEAMTLARYRPRNLIEPMFWFHVLGLGLVPRSILRALIDRFKPLLSGVRRANVATIRN